MATTITPDSLNVQDPLKTVTPTPDMNNYQSIIDTGAADAKTALDTITADNTKLASKTADTQALNESLGVNSANADIGKYTTQLADINANLSGLANEAKAIPLTVQEQNKNTGATDAGVAPQTTGKLRENAIKALTQSSLADVLSANITGSTIKLNNAKEKVAQSLDLKYKPIEDEITNLKDQLALNKQYLTDPAEIKLAHAQERILNERTRILTEQKTNEQNVANIALEVAKNGGSPELVARIGTAKDAKSAIAMAGSALATKDTQITTLADGSTVLVDKKTGNIIRTVAGGSTTSTNLPSSVVRTVTGTNGGQTPVAGYTLKSGDDPYQVAINNGIDLNTLKSLNPDVKDWTKLPVGYVLNLPSKDDNWLNGKTPEQITAYNSLPDTEKAGIKSLVNGDILLSDYVKSRGKNTKAQIDDVITKATAIDPNFSVNTNKQRNAYQTQFNNPNGKEQLQIVAINTGLGHLAEFKTASDALGNTIILPYNKLVNYLKKNTGDPKVAQLNTVVTALAGELASVYKGGGAPTDQETEQWRNTILSSFSQSQSKGVSDTTANLISNKLQALSNSYKNVMGAYPDNPIINSDVLQQLNEAGVDTTSITSKLKTQGYAVPESNPASNTGGATTFMGINLPSMKPQTGGNFGGFTLVH